MEALYILNENAYYLRMALTSLSSLRKYNPELKTTIIFVEDNCRDSRDISISGIRPLKKELFFNYCQENNIKIDIYKNVDLKEENGYYSAQRVLFANYKNETILLLDADTIIYDNISYLFEKYKHKDIVATTNTFGDHFNLIWDNKEIKPLNSGVVIFNKGLLSAYGERILEYTTSLKNKTHPLSEWLYSVSPEANGREELAFNLFILENDLNYEYFEKSDVQKEVLIDQAKIFHTLTPNWINFMNGIKPKKKLTTKFIKNR
jgi:hypothetical protein